MKTIAASITTVLLTVSLAWAQTGDTIIGKYHLPNQLDIEIFESDGKYFGKIIGLDGFADGQQNDIHNPEKSNQNDPLLGKTIIKNLEFDESEKEWVNGSMYGPEKGLVFNLKITEARQDEIKVVASKYLFWKTMAWEKL